MKLLQHARFGAPLAVLELLDVPEPVLGPHYVVVDVEATPIHTGDLKNIAG